MRVIGLDWGEKRVGVAVSDPLGISALPVRSLDNDDKLIENLKNIIREYDAGEIVLGLPRQMSGASGAAASKTMKFCEKLSKELPIKVSLWDERLTTKAAQGAFQASGAPRKKRKAFIDAVAAGIMLQSYIDSKRL